MSTPRSNVFFCHGCCTTRSVVHLGRAFHAASDESKFFCDECLEEEEPEERFVADRELRLEIEENGLWAATFRWAIEHGQDISQGRILDVTD